MSKVYISSVYIKKYSVKTNRQFTYKGTSGNYAHCSTLDYITHPKDTIPDAQKTDII